MSYLFSAPSRTPVAIELQNPMQITWDSDPRQLDDDETGLSLWHAEYPYGKSLFIQFILITRIHLTITQRGKCTVTRLHRARKKWSLLGIKPQIL